MFYLILLRHRNVHEGLSMFNTQPLITSKREILCSAVDLLNAQSKALKARHDFFMELVAKKNLLLSKKQEDFLAEINQIDLYPNKIITNQFIDNFNEFRKSILAANVDTDAVLNIHITDPFAFPYSPDNALEESSCFYPFFNSNEYYKQAKAARATFEVNVKAYEDMISFRQHAAGAIIVGLYFIGVLAAFGVSLAVSLFISPIGGGALFGLVAATHLYYIFRIFDDIERLQDSFTSINKDVNLLSGLDGTKKIDENSFSEFDELQANKEALSMQPSMC